MVFSLLVEKMGAAPEKREVLCLLLLASVICPDPVFGAFYLICWTAFV